MSRRLKIYIDLGHGGNDSGAINKARNVMEKNIVLEIGKILETKLKACGLDVKLSRTGDITKSLSERTNEANKWGADILVSLHVNDARKKDANGNWITDKAAHGLETYCYKLKYRKLADDIHNELVKANLYNKNRGVKEQNLHMVRESNMSAALVELFFINNDNDVNKLLNKKEEFATAIAKGICKNVGVTYVNQEVNKPSNVKITDGSYSNRKAKVVKVPQNDVLYVRYDRNPKEKELGKLQNGAIVVCQYCKNGWMSIEGYKGNKGLGYVHAAYLELI